MTRKAGTLQNVSKLCLVITGSRARILPVDVGLRRRISRGAGKPRRASAAERLRSSCPLLRLHCPRPRSGVGNSCSRVPFLFDSDSAPGIRCGSPHELAQAFIACSVRASIGFSHSTKACRRASRRLVRHHRHLSRRRRSRRHRMLRQPPCSRRPSSSPRSRRCN